MALRFTQQLDSRRRSPSSSANIFSSPLCVNWGKRDSIQSRNSCLATVSSGVAPRVSLWSLACERSETKVARSAASGWSCAGAARYVQEDKDRKPHLKRIK